MISRRYSLLMFWAFASFFSYSQKINFFEFFVKQYEKEIGEEISLDNYYILDFVLLYIFVM